MIRERKKCGGGMKKMCAVTFATLIGDTIAKLAAIKADHTIAR
jgi:hypothetical protein